VRCGAHLPCGHPARPGIGALLKQARQDTALSQRQLARRIGVPPSTLSRYESGAALPSLPMLDRILAACGKDVQATLVQRYADLDAELDRLAAQPLYERLMDVELLTPGFVDRLGALGCVLVGGAWAAAIHGIPREHGRGRLWLAGDEESIAAVAALFHRHFATLLEEGAFCGLEVRPGTFARHPTATWRVTLVGRFDTCVVPPGTPWPPEVRIDAEAGPLRVVVPEQLGEQDGVRPELLARWLARRSAGAA
jgi:transcriptional regulator with XRE-family HTH domain